jgi:multidrug resistance efflux pump
MEAILLGIYGFFVWLIFIKFKWLPWNITSQVIVAIIPIVGLTILILTLNVVAPSSTQLRVYRYTVPIVSQVRGRVIEVGVEEGNRLVHKGDVLFKIDPEPYQLEYNNLKAQLATAEAAQRQLLESQKGAKAKVTESRAAIAAADSQVRQVNAKLALARKRVEQNRQLVASGAGNKFDLEQAETTLAETESQLAAAQSQAAQARAGETQATASAEQVAQQLGATVDGTFAQVAQIKAQLENAKWNLDQTVTRSPCECYVINLQLRVGGFVAALPVNPVMELVEADRQIIAFYAQNELTRVKPGDEAEFAFEAYPGQIVKATVDSVVWATAQGQQGPTGLVPMSQIGNQPPGRFAVKFNIAPKDKDMFLAAGAVGDAAIYTEHVEAIHIIRKVILRVGSYENYLILKLH